MSKKVLIVSSTYRIKGNSELLADSFSKGATDAGHVIERLDLRDFKLEFCTGCLVCQKSNEPMCVLKDDMSPYLQRIQDVDVIVFVTPIYFYAMSGKLKTFIDRLNPLYPHDYQFRDIYLLASAADDNASAMDGAIKEVQGWIDCFEKTELKGVVRALGVVNKGDVNGMNYVSSAYDMGKNI